MDRFFDLPLGSTANPDVARRFRRNFLVNAADGMSWYFGLSFVSVSAILPVYASRLTDSPLVIGLIPAMLDAGWFLPQLFMAPYVERLPRKLPFVGWLAALERLPFLALALAALWLPGLPRRLAVLVFLAVMAWRSLASGLVAMPWQELIATVIPVSHRGRFFGIANLTGQLLGVFGAALAAFILARLPYPQNYALAFFIGFLGTALSYAFLMLTVEPTPAPREHLPHSTRLYLRRLGTILRANANFRTYILTRGLWYLGSMASGFIAVYAVQKFALPDSQAGVFTAILLGSGVIGYGIWGPVGDRMGHKRVLELSGTLWIAALVVALLGPSVPSLYVVFALMGFGSAGGVVGDLNIAMEFGPESERPTYVGLARTVTGPALLLAPLAAGVILEAADYPTMFGVSLVFAVSGLALLWLRVVEPRHVFAPSEDA
jgi:MFS family permease